jgi:uncharacterized membrane protein YcaP (DUF421 family)
VLLRVDETSDMTAFYDFISPLLGLGVEPKDLTFIQISLRGVIVFIATLVMIRVGHKRSPARKTAFDAVLIVILASDLKNIRTSYVERSGDISFIPNGKGS